MIDYLNPSKILLFQCSFSPRLNCQKCLMGHHVYCWSCAFSFKGNGIKILCTTKSYFITQYYSGDSACSAHHLLALKSEQPSFKMLSTFQRCSLLITLFKNLNPLCTDIIVHRGLYSIALFFQFFLCLEPELFCGFIACSHVDFQSKNGLQSYCTSFINDQFLMDRLTSGQGPIWRKDLLAGYIVQQCLQWWWCLLSALLRLVLKIKEHFCSFVLWLMMYVCGNQSRFFDRKYIYLLHSSTDIP